jgi:hypothetical protein
MYRVRWRQEALDDLTTIWLQPDSPTREEITSAAHAIDLSLRSDPFQASESRGENEYVHFCYPLGISFEIDSAGSTACILHVWQLRRRR